ncbi:MAG: choice-of-anchor C family protein [Cyanobacteria bacterium P01_E01_bin.42]
MKRKIMQSLQVILVVLALIFVAVGFPDRAQAAPNLIKNGGLESGVNPGLSFKRFRIGYAGIDNWTIIGGTVDYIGGTWQPSEGSHSLDLDGAEGSAGGIEQTFDTVPGQKYKVTFDLSGNYIKRPATKMMKISAAGKSAEFTFDGSTNSRTDMGWQPQTWSFKATDSTTTLTFLSLNGSGFGPALDNIVVTAVGEVVTPVAPSCPKSNLIANGGLESGVNPGSSFKRFRIGYAGIDNWTIIGGTVDYIGGTWQPSEGSRSLDLDGAEGSAGGIEQTFDTVPGQKYKVTFDLSGNYIKRPAIKMMKVSAAGDSAEFTFDGTSNSKTDMGWQPQTWSFKATDSTTTLTLLSLNGSGFGAAVDNIAVTAICSKPPEPKPNKCDPNKPIPGAFSSIRIGDLDGFGFGKGEGLTAASGGSVNADGKGILSTGDFLPDFNGDGKFSSRDGGDPFDNRSDAEVAGTFLTGSGYEDMGSTGSDYTDLFLGKAFGKKGSSTFGRPFPDGDPKTLPNQPGFKFRFKVAKDKLPEGTPLFLNTMLGDYDVKPVQVILKKANGNTVTKEIKVSAKGKSDGQIQASFIRLKFEQVFLDGDKNGEPGYWVGSLDVDFDAPREPSTSFDFSEIGTNKIPLQPCQ